MNVYAEALDEGLVGIQAQVFEAVADHGLLIGTLLDLSLQFGITPTAFLTCLDGLITAGWVRSDVDPDSIFSIRLEL